VGNIKRFDLKRIITEYRTDCFFETGTFRGEGVEHALEYSFGRVISCEIIPEIAQAAAKKFSGEPRVKIVEADSMTALKKELPGVNERCVFWLDAHFPGADAGLTAYDAEGSEDIRLPLEKELETIRRLRPKGRDVMIIDDLRIYEDGPYENGNVPADALPKMNRSIDFVYRYFGRSHFVLKLYRDEGYLLLFPKRKYRKKHFRFSTLFTWKMEEDFYLKDKNKM